MIRPSRDRRVLAISLLTIVLACSTPRQRVEVEAAFGRVTAPPQSLVEGEQVARLLDALAPDVAVLLGVPAESGVEVCLDEEELTRGFGGKRIIACLRVGRSACIHLGHATVRRGLLRYVLTHELVHWYAHKHGGSLPDLLEEAVADYIGHLAEPRSSFKASLDLSDLRASLDVSDAPPPRSEFDVLTMTHEQFWDLSPEERKRALIASHRLAEELGYGRLMALVTRDDNPLEALLAPAHH